MGLERYDEAKAVPEAASSRSLNPDTLHIARFVLAFLEGDRPRMQEQVKWAGGRPGTEDRLLEDWAHAAALRDGAKARVLEYRASEALHEAHVGNLAAARETARDVLASQPAGEVKATAAMALAVAGDHAAAGRIVAELSAASGGRDPEYRLATIRALIAIGAGDGDAAVDLLRDAVRPRGLPQLVRRFCANRPGASTRTFSRCGRTPMPTFPS